MSGKRYSGVFERLLANSEGPPEGQLDTGCWPWAGKLNNCNYGVFNARVDGRHKTLYAHREMEQVMRDFQAQLDCGHGRA